MISAKFYTSFSSNFETESCLIFCPQTFLVITQSQLIEEKSSIAFTLNATSSHAYLSH